MANSKYEYVKKFELDNQLPPSNWLVVRIDGCSFHRFSAVHEFEKPNDEHALNLMNACASAMLEQFPVIVFAYGVSDEYMFENPRIVACSGIEEPIDEVTWAAQPPLLHGLLTWAV
ncbi:tRNA(His) guanylyltransferase 1 [Acorus gramineus]|uniref:tRNA(His) guanylyltransferase 1 n=1 Tax=Acorus gramineus TaxID=55184 RepID=A0AAV9A699_ACOGR|nr:tRNA(His) guanylyltransferase 1 [Acorus gramineus]